MIKVSGVSKRFPNGTLALDAVTTEIGKGDFVALLGPSGCGKSTLLRLIAGLERPSEGQITWEGGAPEPGEIGFVFQDSTLMPWASAAENVYLPLKLRRKSRAATAGTCRPRSPRWGWRILPAANPPHSPAA